MAKTTRKGSGRTKGSFSFVKVTLGQLKSKFSDDTQPITVGRKWAEEVGFTGLFSAPATQIAGQIQGLTPKSAVDVKTTILD